ncbi:MAG: amidase family protein [Bifidobacteriaceae bacterium]|nr:amidase family protein [Bifidobacteriaceae bacterium]
MLTVSQYRAAYLNGNLTPSAVIAEHQRYAQSVAKVTNAISVLNPKAQDAAAASDARYAAGTPKGSLDGVPVIVKDSYHVAGLPRWHGSAIHDGDPVSVFSSEPIERLEQAGAIIIAKGTMPDMGMLASGISSQFGIVRNPWDTRMSPGGSSSGVGAALASGLAAFGLGTDIAGSVRLPAAHCGLAAIKPTQGRIAYSPASVMRSSGVLARTVADVIEGLSIVGQQAASDPWCLPGRFTPVPAQQVLAGTPRVGVLLDMGYGVAPAPQIVAAVEAAAHRLEGMGCVVQPVSLSLTDADFDNADRVFKAHAAAEIRCSRHPEAVLGLVADWVKEAEGLSMADYEDAMNGLLGTVARIEKAIEPFDYLISPVIPVVGFPAESPGPGDETELLHHTQFTAWWNQATQPAAVYCETMDDAAHLPIDVQVVGRRFDDAGVLALAGVLESTRGFDMTFPTFEGVPDGNE